MMKKEVDQEIKKELLKKLIVEGVVVSARYGANKFDDTNKYRIALKCDDINYDDIHAYDNVGTKLTPSWYKNRDGYINFSSIYSIPVMDASGRRISFDEWLENYNVLGSIVKISFKQKDGAVYPEAIKVLEDGEERDPFADM